MGCLKLTYRSQVKIPISRDREHKSPLRIVYQKPHFKAKTVQGFISVDPLADKYADLNPYNYAGNKPINKIDIDGLQEQGKEESKTPETDGNDLLHPAPVALPSETTNRPNSVTNMKKNLELDTNSFVPKEKTTASKEETISMVESFLSGYSNLGKAADNIINRLKGNAKWSFGTVISSDESNGNQNGVISKADRDAKLLEIDYEIIQLIESVAMARTMRNAGKRKQANEDSKLDPQETNFNKMRKPYKDLYMRNQKLKGVMQGRIAYAKKYNQKMDQRMYEDYMKMINVIDKKIMKEIAKEILWKDKEESVANTSVENTQSKPDTIWYTGGILKLDALNRRYLLRDSTNYGIIYHKTFLVPGSFLTKSNKKEYENN